VIVTHWMTANPLFSQPVITYNNNMPIRILPPEVSSQIAAGEVIERPASVVKELIENAIDARAGSISVTTEGAGQRLIQISDDGCGIATSELPLAMERHATSKLQDAGDLFRINTLGFRGEALASIGSVSRLTITTRTADASQGARLHVDGGKAVTVQPTGAPVGTLVRVEDLFYNVPARLKFMKKDVTERRHIDDLVTRYALAYPNIRFQLEQEKRKALQTSGNGDRREVLASMYGADTARQMLEVISKHENISVTGFISPTSLTRSNRRGILFFVNGRPVQDSSLSAALTRAYHTLLMTGRFPLAVLFLELPPETVDVNVHPAKAEVRFREPGGIFSGVQSAVRRALLAHNPVPGVDGQLRWAQGEPPWQGASWGVTGEPTGPFRELDRQDGEGQIQPDAEGQAAIPTGRIPLLRPVGQVANAYLVAEGPDGLYLIDQHAAHERVLFERFMAQRGEDIPSQALLEAVSVELSPSNARLLAEQLPVLSKLGFHVEEFGPGTFLVRAIPNILEKVEPAAAIHVLVEDFEEDETPLQSEIESKIIARVCKQAAVKSGQTLSPQEQRALLLDLETCESPRTCPHGRPTMIHLSVDLLERQFGRRGAR